MVQVSVTAPIALGNVMMRLGTFKFWIATATYQTLDRSTSWKWPSQSRFLLGPSSQFVGNGEDTIALAGVVYTELYGAGSMDTLREMAGVGITYRLISGTGTIMGNWIIESVQEKQSLFAAFGSARKQEFTINLRRQYP